MFAHKSTVAELHPMYTANLNSATNLLHRKKSLKCNCWNKLPVYKFLKKKPISNTKWEKRLFIQIQIIVRTHIGKASSQNEKLSCKLLNSLLWYSFLTLLNLTGHTNYSKAQISSLEAIRLPGWHKYCSVLLKELTTLFCIKHSLSKWPNFFFYFLVKIMNHAKWPCFKMKINMLQEMSAKLGQNTSIKNSGKRKQIN